MINTQTMARTQQNRGILWLALESQAASAVPVQAEFDQLAAHFHVTLQYNVPLTPEIEELLASGPIQARAVANCHNDRIQAVRIDLPESVRTLCQNENPHMTVSMVEGARPVLSNLMLHHDHVSEPVSQELNFRFEFFPFS